MQAAVRPLKVSIEVNGVGEGGESRKKSGKVCKCNFRVGNLSSNAKFFKVEWIISVRIVDLYGIYL